MLNYMITESSKEEEDLVWEGILEYDKETGSLTGTTVIKVNRMIKDKNNNIIGGLKGVIVHHFSTLYIELLWIKKEYRKSGYGSILLKEVEKIAMEQKCSYVHLETDQRAKDFYIKNGYEVFGELDDVPYGFTRYYLKKRTK